MEEVNGNVRDELRTTLASSENLSPQLASMVRRFKAVTTLLRMRRDAAYTDLDGYTKCLHNWINEFDEKMRTSINLAYSEKIAIIKACREELEEELSTLGVLLKESEKLLNASTNFDATQKKHGKTLITALKMMKTTSRMETGDVGENLSCLSLFTQLDCDNLPELGHLNTKYTSDEMIGQSEEKPPEKSNLSERDHQITTESTDTNTDDVFEIEKAEEPTVKKVKRNTDNRHKSREKRSNINQQNQRFIISQLEKGGISKQGPRCLTGETGSEAAVLNSGNTEEQRPRRPIIRAATFKPFSASPKKSAVSKKRDCCNGTADIKDAMILAQSATEIVNSDVASTQKSKWLKLDQMNSLSWENELSNTDAHVNTQKRFEDNKCASVETTIPNPEMKTTLSVPIENKQSTHKDDPLSMNKIPTSEGDINMKSPEPIPMESGDYQRTSTPKSLPPEKIKTEPITPVEAMIKQEPQTPADLNNNCALTGQPTVENPVVKRCFSASSTETWENDVDIMNKTVEKKALPKEEFQEIITGVEVITKSNEILDGVSPQKDMNCNIIDSGIHSSDDSSSADKNESKNNGVQETGKNMINEDESSSNKGVESKQKDPVSNELDCSVSSIPLPKSPFPSTVTKPQDKNDLNDNEVEESCKTVVNANDNVSSSDAERNQKDPGINELDISVSKILLFKSSDLPKETTPQELPNSETVTDNVITKHAREELNKDSVITRHVKTQQSKGIKHFVPPISAKMLFKAGNEDIMKFPIGVTTNSVGEILVGDTGNHVVRVFSCKGKYLRDIGKEKYMRRPSAIVVNQKDEVFVKDDVAVFAFKADGTHIRTIAKGKLGHPFGLALTPDGYLVTLDTTRTNPRVFILSQDGSRLDSFPFAHLRKANTPTSSKCRFLAVQAERLIVSDLGTSCIYISDNCGQILFEFGGYGNLIRQFREPSGVTTDQQGNMLIGDSKNDRIQIFKPNGSYLCDIQFDKPIQRPSDIHLTRDGKLYVSNFLLHAVYVYQLGQQ